MYIINAKINTMDCCDRIIENGFIETDEGKILRVGAMEELSHIPENCTDAGGRCVYPGFIDAHTHLGMFEDSLTFEGDDGNESTDPVSPQLRSIDGANPFDRCFDDAVKAGVTTVLISPGSTNPVAGQIAAIKTYGKCIDKMIIKEPAAIKFSLGENPKSTYNDKDQIPVTRMGIASLIRETLYKAKKYYNDKKNYEENSSEYDEPEFDMKNEALLPLFKGDIPGHFHAHRADDIFTAIRICREFGIRCVIVHGTEGHLIADELKDNCEGILSGPIMTDRSKPELKNLSLSSPGIISSSGIPTALITDHPETPIEQINICLALAVREGMTERAALQAVTSAAAKLCNIYERVGSIEAGKDADLVIYDSSPLNITEKPRMVIINGKAVFNTLL